MDDEEASFFRHSNKRPRQVSPSSSSSTSSSDHSPVKHKVVPESGKTSTEDDEVVERRRRSSSLTPPPRIIPHRPAKSILPPRLKRAASPEPIDDISTTEPPIAVQREDKHGEDRIIEIMIIGIFVSIGENIIPDSKKWENALRLRIRMNTLLSIPKHAFCRSNGVERVDECILSLNGVKIFDHVTMGTLGIEEEVCFEIHTRMGWKYLEEHPNARTVREETPKIEVEKEEGEEYIHLTLRNSAGLKLAVRGKPGTRVTTILHGFATKHELDESKLALKFEGEVLDSQSLLKETDLEDGEQVDVIDL